MAETIINVENLSMMYNLSRKKEQHLKEYVINFLKGELFFDEFWALKDISFSLQQGESLGIVGVNGSGKSTLLKLIAGLMKPTKGTVYTNGNIAPLIELGGGFDRDMTAVENIYFIGSMHGNSKRFMRERIDEIIDFAELWEFTDVPLRNFSSGMLSRLAFSIATVVKADILIADEILSVGDVGFKKKCGQRIEAMRNGGATVLFVSHSTEQVKAVCDKAIWLNDGKLIMLGGSTEVCDSYIDYINKASSLSMGDSIWN